MSIQFLTLEDAVKVAAWNWGVDKELAEQEFEQKCFISDDQYEIGFDDGIEAAVEAIEQMAEKRYEQNE